MNQAFEAIKNHAGVADDVAKWINLAATHLGVQASAIPDSIPKTLLGVVTAGDVPEDSPAKRPRESSRPIQVGESLREKLKDAGVECKTETVSCEFKEEPAQRDSCLLFEGNRIWVIGTMDDGVSPKDAPLCIKSAKIKVHDGVVSLKRVDCSKQVPSILRSGLDTNAVILDQAYMLIGTTLPSGSRETYLWNMYSEDASRRWILPNITAEPGCFTPSFLAEDESARCLLFTKSGRIKEITRFRKGRFQLCDVTPPEGPLFVTAVNQTNSTNLRDEQWGFLCACKAADGTQFLTTVIYNVEKGVSLIKTTHFPSPKTTTSLCTWGSTIVFADENGRVDAVFGDIGRRTTLVKANEPEWASVTTLVIILQPWLLFANRFITVRFHKKTVFLTNTVCTW
jgi:hypothetical protein